MTEISTPSVEAASPEPSLTLLQRLAAVFVSPGKAWGGLETRVQWWFPMLLVALVSTAGSFALYDRAVMPMMRDSFDEKVAAGEMSTEQAAQTEQMMASPVGRLFGLIPAALFPGIVLLLTGLAISFAVGFLLGGKLRFRLGLEVASWSALVAIPGQLLAYTLGWVQESFQNVHIGFGAFLPEQDTPSKLMVFLGSILDAIGPFAIWNLAVMILGASALSGLPRGKVAWTIGAVYLVLWVAFSGLTAMFAPGA